MNKEQANDLWAHVYADRAVDHWRGVDRVALNYESPLLRSAPMAVYAGPDSEYLKLFGCLVMLDRRMNPNELKLIASDGSTVRIVNIGE